MSTSVAALTNGEFLKFADLIEQEIGIHLSDAKRPLLVARLGKRVRHLGLESFTQYFDYVVEGNDSQERTAMFDAISTNETRFFREPKHFEILTTQVLPQWKAQAENGERAKSVRIWSAGCSTGEEPYSLAMTLLEHFDPAEWDLRVDATDVSTRALAAARRGVWPLSKSGPIPPDLLRRYMLRGVRSQQELFTAGEEVRSLIRFARLNLADDQYRLPGEYDIILCRNVLIYFVNDMRTRVVSRLLSHLRPRGYFFLGHAETLSGIADGLRTVIPTVYVK